MSIEVVDSGKRIGEKRGTLKSIFLRGIMVMTALLLLALNVQAEGGSDSSGLSKEILLIMIIVILLIIIVILYVAVRKKAKKRAKKKVPSEPMLINVDLVLTILEKEKDWDEDRLEKAKRTIERVNELRGDK